MLVPGNINRNVDKAKVILITNNAKMGYDY